MMTPPEARYFIENSEDPEFNWMNHNLRTRALILAWASLCKPAPACYSLVSFRALDRVCWN